MCVGIVAQAESAGPRRASLRQKGVSADGRMIDQELRNGQVVLSTDGYSGPWNVAESQAAPEPDQLKERHPQGEQPAASCSCQLLLLVVHCLCANEARVLGV